MKSIYENWIREYINRNNGYVVAKCQYAISEMAEVFPELTPVAGWYGETEHWWLVDPNGEIIDPTVSQFPFPQHYKVFSAGDKVRVGKCMDCGSDIYEKVQSLDGNRKSFCSSNCEISFAEDMNHSDTE